ncbi:MAG: TIGR01212 family radical SAM protein [Thermoguttaceae bacterium]|nr:TIGR01212 family radical SAM protein [Thermoguttaceae bacterium]
MEDYYYPLSRYFRRTFGRPVRKVTVDAGFSCPNRDGTVGTRGCIFCDNRSFSPARRMGIGSITRQIDEGIARVSRRFADAAFIAYFQPSTNTYAPVDHLEALYRQAISHPQISGLAIGTRPDCVGDDVLDLLARLSRETWLLLELGLQSSCDQTLAFLNRGHNFASFLDAVKRASQRNLRLGVHVILALPGEGRGQCRRTAEILAALPIHSIKLHNLYVVRDTPLAELWAAGQIPLPSLEEYAGLAVDFLERIPEDVVIERLAGDAPRDFLLAPAWSAEKNAARLAIERQFAQRGTRQGAFVPPRE